MIVVGVDLSLTGTGIARLTVPDDEPTAREFETATLGSKGRKDDPLHTRHRRLAKSTHEILDQVLQHPALPQLVVIESPAYSRQLGHQHDRSGLWWLVTSALLDVVPVLEVAPSARAKYGAGSGNASKAAVLLAVERIWPEAGVSNDNEADAVVLAAIGARALRAPIDSSTKIKADVMKALVRPEGIS